MNVPLLDLTRENTPLLPEIESSMRSILDGSNFIMGEAIDHFESSILHYLNASPDEVFALAVSSGTDALLLAMMALDIGAGDEVISTPYTFFATTGTIDRLGAKAVFVDIEKDSFNIDPSKIEAAITDKTKAICPVHLYGQMVEMDLILEIAKKHNLFVIEDSAQAMGARYGNEYAGLLGDFGGISFFPTKNLGAFGDAGLLVSRRMDLKERTFRMRVHGQKNLYSHYEVGGNFRMDALQARVLDIKLPHLNNWHKMRRKNAFHYYERLLPLENEGHILLPVELAQGSNSKKERYHIYNQYVIRVKNGKRDELKQFLDNEKIGNAIYYPSPMHTQPCFLHLGYKAGDFPIAENTCKEVLALPVHSFISKDEIEFVCKKIIHFFKK